MPRFNWITKIHINTMIMKVIQEDRSYSIISMLRALPFEGP